MNKHQTGIGFMRLIWFAVFAVVSLAAVRSAAASLPAEAVQDPSVYYVDAAVVASGNGQSWAAAFKTIGEALAQPLEPGSIVWIRPGVYVEDIGVDQSGAEVVPLTTGVAALAGNQVVFPAGTDLSGVDLAAHPGEYFLYVARSWVSNNGVYEITDVDVPSRTVTVAETGPLLITEPDFVPETGVAGDAAALSAAIGRPVQVRNADPQAGYVVLDAQGTSIYTLLYIGDGWVDPCGADNPVSYILVDGLHLTNASGGAHVQDASFTVLANSRITHMSEATGIYVNGNVTHPARYNYFINNEIYDPTSEAIYIGAGDQGEDCNYTQFTHVIGNDISHSENTWMENAIEVKEYHDTGTVIEGNVIHDFTLDYFWNGAINLQGGASDTLIYGNTLRDITPNYEEGPIYIVGLEAREDILTRDVHFFNNRIYNTTPSTQTIYAIAARGDNTENVGIYHNTIHNINGGLYLHYDAGDGSDNGVYFKNNIVDIPEGFPLITDEDWVLTGTFTLSHNFFSRTPEAYSDVTLWTGDPGFVAAPGDLHLAAGSPAIDKAASLTPTLTRDLELALRDSHPDLGAFEYQKPSSVLFLPLVLR
ncbi:MAG: right-handed parallel beta-helix repeat-containing protein [Anaerolineae bacterium]|nr:right-handed parallel beta-helix repeat-containing protein [Anaerolineae bacterium]